MRTDHPIDLTDPFYAAVRAAAVRLLARERRSHTLQATALVHEACLRLARGASPGVASVAGYLQTMRRILVDHARRRRARLRATSIAAARGADRSPADALHVALRELAGSRPRLAQVVQLRHLGGWSVTEVARFLGITERTVARDECAARAVLRDLLEES